jgi:transposase-like protein
MKKNRTSRASKGTGFSPREAGVSGPKTLPEVLADTRIALRDLVLEKGFEVFAKLLEEDRERLCGPPNRPQSDRQNYRYGFTEARAVFGGQKITVEKPRVRSIEGEEVELPHWRGITDEDPLERRVVEQMLVGVSTRKYKRSLESAPGETEPKSVSRSSVSRHFVERTCRAVEEMLARPLGDLDLPILMIDGKNFGDHVLVVVMGIDRSGRKHVLGVVEGTTESEEVGKSLLRDLIERGLPVERPRLVVLDGGKGVRKAVRAALGQWVLIQRCQVHKLRNILEHLPEAKRIWVRAAVRKAHAEQTAEKGRMRLLELATQLEDQHPGAAGSIREGLDETLTILELGLSGWLAKTLRSTNPIENLHSTLGRISRNVTRWRGGSMARRWAVAGLLEAEKKFRRIKGHASMPHFLAALDALIRPATQSIEPKEMIA